MTESRSGLGEASGNRSHRGNPNQPTQTKTSQKNELFTGSAFVPLYRTRVLGHQFDDLAYVRRTVLKTTHEDAPGSTRQGESIPGVPPQ